jgi:hypothetical protein
MRVVLISSIVLCLMLFSGCPQKGPVELAYDDGSQNGKRSIAGGGHAVNFERPTSKSKLQQIKIYSSRYGRPGDSRIYKISLLDSSKKVFYMQDGNYQEFAYASEGWMIIDINPPVFVPKNFTICFEFNPTQNCGVYVYYDTDTQGNSRNGTSQSKLNQDPGFNWMIRAVVG